MFRIPRKSASPEPALEPRARALGALDRREFGEAERELGALLEREPKDSPERAFFYNKRGVARVGLLQLESARSDFLAALEIRPAYAPALVNLGNLALERGETDAAISQYEAAIRADDTYAVAHLNLGVAYKRAGRIADSVRALRKAQALERRAFSAASSWPRTR